MYYKLIEKGAVLDLVNEIKWVKYLPKLKCFVGTDKSSANAIMGSDNDTIYHLEGTEYNFPKNLKTITVEEIDKKEFNSLQTQFLLQKKNALEIEEKFSSLKEQFLQQNELLNLILKRFSGFLER